MGSQRVGHNWVTFTFSSLSVILGNYCCFKTQGRSQLSQKTFWPPSESPFIDVLISHFWIYVLVSVPLLKAEPPGGKDSLFSSVFPERRTVCTVGSISVQFSSVTQSCLTLCDPMDCSTPGLPIHHQLPELVQTHGHRLGDAIQPSHPLSSPSPPAFSLFQHQGLFQWVSSLYQVAKILEFQLHQSFRWTPRTDLL